uniref:Uncharacterized protein n=1 Tax=Craspedostauros australis TaxID=1486917 RepID=A0A7R9ZPC9_9STRA|mmetsp:Transcript_2815/g.7791  ORF Transcript_2815/g.7791 Transcript_2815/m.7791 type:complete len:159 (+) Transcript_2815:407-883(+)
MMDQFDPVSPAFTRRDRNSIDLHNSGSTSQHSHHSGPTTNHHSMQQQQQQPTPLQQRMATAEVHRSKKQRKMEQERVYQDLTARLDQECRKTQELESTLEQRERQWLLHFQQLEEDRDAQKRNVDVEKDENKRLRDSLGRKDQEIYRVLQRKVRYSRC